MTGSVPARFALFLIAAAAGLLPSAACRYPARTKVHSFADYPGFREYYRDRCRTPEPPPGPQDRALLEQFRPRFFLPPGGKPPIDFYRDYLPCTVMRRVSDGTVVAEQVTPEALAANRDNREVYLDFLPERAQPERAPVVYGRIYREAVTFPTEGGRSRPYRLTFLKYNAVFAASGLAAGVPRVFGILLRILGLPPEDWHELDNFVAVHVVLDEAMRPFAVLLAQHNGHRTYLVGRQIPLPADDRFSFDIALRSNEVYPSSDSEKPVRHRAVRGNRELRYLLSGEDPPLLAADDITIGRLAGGREISYDLAFLSPCDPLYTATTLLGEPRPFLGRYIGRDGPPGSDYYAVPPLLPLGNLLQFGYLQDGDEEDIRMVEGAVDRNRKTVDIERIREHGGRRLFRDWTALPR
ncbi:MAG: hypothetical protein Kow00128_01940 [Deltaproteobacteria bacterium]